MSNDTKDYGRFVYVIGFTKKTSRYVLDFYNSPYRQSETEFDDIAIIMSGKDSRGNPFPSYKTVQWEGLKEGKYKATVEMFYTPNGDGTHDQLFHLIGPIEEV